jgi:TolB-like protein/tetratricopeptide (TPR) repeat protein
LSVERSELNVERSAPRGAVFLSYAREDSAAARRIADALRGFGVEVWLDQSELRGGDAWDQKIRRQIKDCALFVPLVSAHTQSRGEGYFRLEWKLAAERTHLMAEGVPFIAPVVIDETPDSAAAVPPEFLRVQWTRLTGAEPTPEFVAQVKRLLAAPRTAAPASVQRTENRGQRTEAGGPAVGRALRARLGWLIGTFAVILLGVFGWRMTHQKSDVVPASEPAARRSAPPTSDKSVAVLAFVNMSAEKDTEYFSDGISEEILDALANNPALRVAARTSSFSFKGKNATAEEIGRALHVASVIEGSVRRSGNQVRITVQLINTADGYHAWSETFTKEMTDIFAVQSEIAAKVAQRLAGSSAVTATPAAATAVAPTKNPAAYDAYLRGRALQTGGLTSPNALEMIRLYEEAVRLDSSYALAWARLSQAYLRMRTGGRDRSEQNATNAKAAATTALRLASNLPEAHLVMASLHLIVDYDLDATQRELDETERLRPNDDEAPALRVNLEFARGHWGDELARLIARAVERDPQNADKLYTLGQVLIYIGRFADAERVENRSYALFPYDGPIRRLAQNYLAWTGDTGGALGIMDAAPESPPKGPVFYSDRARLRALHGDIAAAIADYEMEKDIRTNRGTATSALPVVQIARLETRQGHDARAKELYAEARNVGRQLATDFPDDPGYASVLARVHAARGEKSEALASLDEATQLAARMHSAVQMANTRQAKAEVLAMLGETDAAIAELRAVHEMARAFGYTLRLDPEWEPLRGAAKFQQLMKEAEARADAQPRPQRPR